MCNCSSWIGLSTEWILVRFKGFWIQQILLHCRCENPSSKIDFVNPVQIKKLNNFWAEFGFSAPKKHSVGGITVMSNIVKMFLKKCIFWKYIYCQSAHEAESHFSLVQACSMILISHHFRYVSSFQLCCVLSGVRTFAKVHIVGFM